MGSCLRSRRSRSSHADDWLGSAINVTEIGEGPEGQRVSFRRAGLLGVIRDAVIMTPLLSVLPVSRARELTAGEQTFERVECAMGADLSSDDQRDGG